METIPKDIWPIIVSEIKDPYDVMRLALTCKLLYYIVRDSSIIGGNYIAFRWWHVCGYIRPRNCSWSGKPRVSKMICEKCHPKCSGCFTAINKSNLSHMIIGTGGRVYCARKCTVVAPIFHKNVKVKYRKNFY